MFQPKRTKYRKQQKGRNTGNAQRGSTLSFGTFGLKATTRGQLTSRQIEAARRAMTRKVKRGAKIWIRVFPDKPITKKPLEVRQGKEKVMWNIGFVLLSLERFYMKWKELMKNLLEKLSLLLQQRCLLLQLL